MIENLQFAAIDGLEVLIVGIILGAGLPAIFALGVRAITPAAAGADGQTVHVGIGRRAAGYACFAIVIAAVLLGISVIVASGFGYEVSFEHVIPTFQEK